MIPLYGRRLYRKYGARKIIPGAKSPTVQQVHNTPPRTEFQDEVEIDAVDHATIIQIQTDRICKLNDAVVLNVEFEFKGSDYVCSDERPRFERAKRIMTHIYFL